MNLLESLLSLQALEFLPRTGWLQRGIAHPESVAAHSYGVAVVALALAGRVEPELDKSRVLAMAIAHDVPEAWLGDLPKTAKRVLPEGSKAEAERRAAEELLGPFSEEAGEAFAEYMTQQSREARFVKLCDRLQLGLRLLGYRKAGHAGLDDFEAGLRELDTGEFAPAEELRGEIVAALEALK